MTGELDWRCSREVSGKQAKTMTLGMEELQSQRILVQCGHGISSGTSGRSASPVPVVGHGHAPRSGRVSLVSRVSLPAVRLSVILKCPPIPTSNGKDPNLLFGKGVASYNLSCPNASSQRRKLVALSGDLTPGVRITYLRELFLIPSQSRAWPPGIQIAYLKKLFLIPSQSRACQRSSKRVNCFKVLKSSASSVLPLLGIKRRLQEFGLERHLSTGCHWKPASPTVFLSTSTSLAWSPLQCAVAGPQSFVKKLPRRHSRAIYGTVKYRCNSSLGVSSVSSQAEGNGSLENTIVLAETRQERQEQYQQQQQASSSFSEQYLATGYGWRVREVTRGELRELQRIADIQADAFHEPVGFFDDLFYKLFHAEVLSSLQYKARHSDPDRYSCLLAERDPSQPGYDDEFLDEDSELAIVGAVDCTALTERDIVSHLPGAQEYLYISGMAVDSNFRRRSVATLLLEACLARAWEWGFDYLVLHAYEDDIRARSLYSRAGYLTVASDPAWMTKFLGRRRRVVMAKRTRQIAEC